jgi:hypothetical protein
MEQKVEFVKGVPPRNGTGRWANQLLPLLDHPGQWALVWTFESPEQANDAQSNLTQRRVIIPHPKSWWEFASRGCEVYAIYRGQLRGR